MRTWNVPGFVSRHSPFALFGRDGVRVTPGQYRRHFRAVS